MCHMVCCHHKGCWCQPHTHGQAALWGWGGVWDPLHKRGRGRGRQSSVAYYVYVQLCRTIPTFIVVVGGLASLYRSAATTRDLVGVCVHMLEDLLRFGVAGALLAGKDAKANCRTTPTIIMVRAGLAGLCRSAAATRDFVVVCVCAALGVMQECA